MVYIVKQKIHGKDYYYLRKSVREKGKVISKNLAYLGKTREEAEKKAKEIIGKMEKEDKGRKAEEKNVKVKSELTREEKTEKIFALAQTRGFFFQTASIYGGNAGFFTFGHLGKQLKTNWENLWRKHYLNLSDNFYEIQSNSILPEKVFVASGHVENFNDPMVDCKKCKFRFRVDQFLEEKGVEDAEALGLEQMQEKIKELNLKCPKCKGVLGEVTQFNMMFPVNIGMDNDNKAYLSPETAQGAFLTFKDEFLATRSKLPLGLAIIDKAYRNEISPRQGFFRLREFSQAELQIFFGPDNLNEHELWNSVEDKNLLVKFANEKQIKEVSCKELHEKFKIPKFYVYYVARVQEFYLEIVGVQKEKFRFRELIEPERAFYNKVHFDIEVVLDTIGGFKEIGGVHYRTDHDLSGHQKVSNKNLEVNVNGKKFIPHVLELSFGDDRNVYSLLDLFFDIGKEGPMFRFPAKLAPVKAAVFPIVKQPEYEKISKEIVDDLKREFNVVYDKGGSIGRRYARNDEIGTPMCITVDDKTPKDKAVTIRDRDTTKQVRVKISELRDVVRRVVEGEDLLKLGKKVETRKK